MHAEEWSLEPMAAFQVTIMAGTDSSGYHAMTLEMRADAPGRGAWKWRLVRGLYERGFAADDVRELFRLIDWMMELPPELEEEFWQEVERFEENRHMPYVTSFERRAIERGRPEGEAEGQVRGLLKGLELSLRLKFGPAGSQFASEIPKETGLEVLEALCDAVEKASSLVELRGIVPSSGS
jgi:hypothetical protein